jgi:hypothetical protein
MNEQVAQAVKMLRKHAQDNLALIDWLESMKVIEAPTETPPVQNISPNE